MAKIAQAQQNLLTPPPKELQKALALSAKRARALAAAYGVKVPYARVKVPKNTSST
jgi:NAD-dependent oxidoreductase involved in siderophore biosynthesis